MEDKKKIQINKFLFIHIGSICMGILVWWMVTDGLGIFRSNALPSPMKVAATFIKKWFETKPDGATLLPVTRWDEAAEVVGCITVYCGDTPIRLIDHITYRKEGKA